MRRRLAPDPTARAGLDERQSGLQQVVEQLQPCVRRGLKDVGIPRRHEVLRVRGLGEKRNTIASVAAGVLFLQAGGLS